MVTNIKYRENILTWSWPPEIELVYINDKLYTLQEYKKRGGYILPKTPGNTTYKIKPFKRENGKDILFEESEITVNFKAKIKCTIKTRTADKYINNEVTFVSEHDIPEDTICYTKNGIMYCIAEPLKSEIPLTRIITTEKNESINIFTHGNFGIIV